MTLTLQNNSTALLAATSMILIRGDDGVYYSLSLSDDGAGRFVLTLGPFGGSLDGSKPFSSSSIGTAFYLRDSAGYSHRFNMVSDGPGTGTYGLQDADQSLTAPSHVEFTVSVARFPSGLTLTDLDGASTHRLTVTGGTLTQDG